MANRFARKTGNWNATDVWSDTPAGVASASFVPVAGDVAMANGFTVTINISATCTEIRTDTTGGATAGGGFTLANGVTLTANVYAGTTSALSFSGASATLVGSVNGGSSGSAHGVVNSGTGTLILTGNVTGGSNVNTFGAHNSSTGTINLTGNATGGSGSPAYGAGNSSTGTINLTGNATGGSGASAHGAYNGNTGTITITGNATGGSGASAYGAYNNGLGALRVGVAVGNNHGPGYATNNGVPGVFGYGTNGGGQPTTSVCGMRFGAYGQAPVAGRVTIDPAGLATAEISARRETTYAEIKFAGPNNNAALPAASDVRDGISYNLGGLIGTCRVPPAASVAFGVPVDNTTGTAALSGGGSGGATAADIWGYADRSLTDKSGFALTAAYDPAKSAASQASIAALNNLSAQQIWEYATRSLTDKASFTLATAYDPAKTAASAALVNAVGAAVAALHDFNPAIDTVAHVALVDATTALTNAPDVPTETEIAAAVRVNLATELARLDQTVSAAKTLTADYDAAKLAASQTSITALAAALAALNNLSASDVWAFATRTLTQSVSGGATPQQIWEYVSTLLPDGAEAALAGLRDRLAAQVPSSAPVVVLPSPTIQQTVAWCRCWDEHGLPEAGAIISIQAAKAPAGAADAYDTRIVQAVSGIDGIASALIPRVAGIEFACWRGESGKKAKFTGVDAESVELPHMLGAEE